MHPRRAEHLGQPWFPLGRGAGGARKVDLDAAEPADRFAHEDDDDRAAAGARSAQRKGEAHSDGSPASAGTDGATAGGTPGAGLPAPGLPGLPGWSGHPGSDGSKKKDKDDEECEEKVLSEQANHLPTIFFEPNRPAIKREGLQTLIDAADALEKDPSLSLQVDIHTHERAGDTFSRHIADRRQLQVLTVLAQHGALASRVSVTTLGEPGDELADHRLARAELTLLGPPSVPSESKQKCDQPAPADQAVIFVGTTWSPTSLPALAAAAEAGKAGRTVAIVAHAGPVPVTEDRRRQARERAAAVRKELADRGVDEHFLRIEVHDTVDPTAPLAPRIELHISDEGATAPPDNAKP